MFMTIRSIATTAFKGHEFTAVAFITICWVGAVIFINPVGEFPSNDDWAYAHSVRALMQQGQISFSDWTAANLISQVFWGALFTLSFGFSYTSLRLSTLVASLIGALLLYRMIKDASGSRLIATMAALLLLFNPLFCALSFSFMTDVPFTAAQTGAMAFLLAGLQSRSAYATGLGWLLALAALLVRQTAFAIPIAYAGAYLIKHNLTTKRVLISLLPLVLLVAAQLGYQHWLASSGKMPLLFGRQMDSAIPTLLSPFNVIYEKTIVTAEYLFFYLGLFLLPISLPTVAALIGGRSRKVALGAWAFIMSATGVIAVITVLSDRIMPIWYNTWRYGGIGPDGLGVDVPKLFWPSITVFSVFGGVLLVLVVVLSTYLVLKKHAKESAVAVILFCLLGLAALAGSLVLVDLKYDRYILPFIPFFALLIVSLPLKDCKQPPRWSVASGGVFLATMACYSIVSTYNYLAEKRVRIAIIDKLIMQGVARDSIDAGWEFNGDRFYTRYGNFAPPHWVPNYVIFRSEPGYTLAERYPVPRLPVWKSRGQDIVVFHNTKIGSAIPMEIAFVRGMWTAGGYPASAGSPPTGEAGYGSWAGDDSHTGTLRWRSGKFPGGQALLIPIVTGVSTVGLEMIVSDSATDQVLFRDTNLPMMDSWIFFKVTLPESVTSITIELRDRGTDPGQWFAVAQPHALPDP